MCVRRGFVEYWGGGSGHMGRGITEGSRDRWCFSTWVVHPNKPPQTLHQKTVIILMVYHSHWPKNEIINTDKRRPFGTFSFSL